MDEKTKKRAKKVVDAGMNISLAGLTESIETNEKLEALLSKEIIIPSLPEEIEITLEGVEYIKGEKGDTSEYPQEVSINNLPEIQKVEVINLPNEKDDTKMLALLKEISQELKKKEQYDYDIEIDPALKEQLKGDNGEDGKDGTLITQEELVSKLNSLTGEVDPKILKGYKDLLVEVERLKNTPRVIQSGHNNFTQQAYLNLVQQSKALAYNVDGSLLSVTDPSGSKTFSYDTGLLVGVTGTGAYRNKSFVYSDSKLTNVNVI